MDPEELLFSLYNLAGLCGVAFESDLPHYDTELVDEVLKSRGFPEKFSIDSLLSGESYWSEKLAKKMRDEVSFGYIDPQTLEAAREVHAKLKDSSKEGSKMTGKKRKRSAKKKQKPAEPWVIDAVNEMINMITHPNNMYAYSLQQPVYPEIKVKPGLCKPLPDETVELIFDFLDVRELCRCKQVCKSFNKMLSNDERYWKPKRLQVGMLSFLM